MMIRRGLWRQRLGSTLVVLVLATGCSRATRQISGSCEAGEPNCPVVTNGSSTGSSSQAGSAGEAGTSAGGSEQGGTGGVGGGGSVSSGGASSGGGGGQTTGAGGTGGVAIEAGGAAGAPDEGIDWEVFGGCDAPPATGAAPLIDDFADNDFLIENNEGREGVWFSFNDGTGTHSQTPNARSDTQNGRLFFSSTLFTDWGGGFAVSLNESSEGSCPYDASFYEGVQFRFTNNVEMKFGVSLLSTTPVARGGTCTERCDNDFIIVIPPAGTARVVKVRFDELMQGTNLAMSDWNASEILAFKWFVLRNEELEYPPAEVVLDDLYFF